MTRNLFNLTNPRYIGFADMFKQIENLLEAGLDNKELAYPPLDIIEHADNEWEVRLAVAGFVKEELTVELKENNTLVITGVSSKDSDKEQEGGPKFLWRGISTRKFVRQLRVTDGTEIKDASLKDGILSIRLFKEIKAPMVKQITIK